PDLALKLRLVYFASESPWYNNVSIFQQKKPAWGKGLNNSLLDRRPLLGGPNSKSFSSNTFGCFPVVPSERRSLAIPAHRWKQPPWLTNCGCIFCVLIRAIPSGTIATVLFFPQVTLRCCSTPCST